MENTERIDWVKALLTMSAPVKFAKQSLAKFPWDFEGQPVELSPSYVAKVLEKFLQGELSALDVEDWAEAVECRDDVDYDEDMADVLYELSTPDIMGRLTTQRAQELLNKLL